MSMSAPSSTSLSCNRRFNHTRRREGRGGREGEREGEREGREGGREGREGGKEGGKGGREGRREGGEGGRRWSNNISRISMLS